MKEIITQKLNEIEQNENVKILLAIESGSRAWGFSSRNSDYDVRFIYLRDIEFYLKLEKTRDVIEWQLDETLDINGWDLKKALRLLYKSNPTFFEWANSPIIYRTSEQWQKIKERAEDYFLTRAGFLHYFNMAKSNYKFLKNDIVKFKKYFYVLRPILACKWLIQRQSPPPMEFEKLVDTQIYDNEVNSIVLDLIEMKRTSFEDANIKKINILNEYIENHFAILNNISNTVKELPNRIEKSYTELDKLFYDILINY